MYLVVLVVQRNTVFSGMKATTTYHFIIDEHSVGANGIEEVVEGGAYLALGAGDKIVGFEESSSDFHVIISGEEHFQPT